MKTSDPPRRVEWRLAERQFTGTPSEVAAQLDQFIVTLVALRRALAAEAEAEPIAQGAAARGSWGARAWSMIGLTPLLRPGSRVGSGCDAPDDVRLHGVDGRHRRL
jgi:hypothetical protein